MDRWWLNSFILFKEENKEENTGENDEACRHKEREIEIIFKDFIADFGDAN